MYYISNPLGIQHPNVNVILLKLFKLYFTSKTSRVCKTFCTILVLSIQNQMFASGHTLHFLYLYVYKLVLFHFTTTTNKMLNQWWMRAAVPIPLFYSTRTPFIVLLCFLQMWPQKGLYAQGYFELAWCACHKLTAADPTQWKCKTF